MMLRETLDALASSVGAQRVRTGFAQTAELDLLWAAGFPNLVWLSDAAPKGGPVALATQWLKKDGVRFGAWPEEVAYLFIHAVDRADRERVKNVEGFLTEVAQDLSAPGPAVLERALRRLLGEGYPHFDGALIPYAIESLAGAAWVIDTALSYLESLPVEAMGAWVVHRCTTLYGLQPVLWRLSPEDRRSAQRRLETLLARVIDVWPHGTYERKVTPTPGHLACALDIATHGGEAFLALHGPGKGSPWHAAATQDPKLCAAFFSALTGEKWSTIGTSAAFVAKDEVLDHYVSQWNRYTQRKHQLDLLDALGTLDDARIVPMMLHMADKSVVKSEVKAWFVDHVAFAASGVSEAAAGGNATAAKMAKAMKI